MRGSQTSDGFRRRRIGIRHADRGEYSGNDDGAGKEGNSSFCCVYLSEEAVCTSISDMNGDSISLGGRSERFGWDRAAQSKWAT